MTAPQAPVLHLLVGPNGSGKTTFARRVILTGAGQSLPFVNADEIAKQRWPGEEEAHAYDTARAAAAERDRMIAARQSFVAETVFSHESKLELLGAARAAGFVVWLYVMVVPEDLAVERVRYRVGDGGHSVPEQKIRERYGRLWPLVAIAAGMADWAVFYDTTRPMLVPIAEFEHGRTAAAPRWPAWAPAVLRSIR